MNSLIKGLKKIINGEERVEEGYSYSNRSETIVDAIFEKNKEKVKGCLLSNVTIKTKGDATTQIDHIFICASGVYVIETKSLSGKINGSRWSKRWECVSNKGKAFSIQNPFRQNYKHLKELERILGDGVKEKLKNIVVITGDVVFDNIVPPSVWSGHEIEKMIQGIRVEEKCIGWLERKKIERKIKKQMAVKSVATDEKHKKGWMTGLREEGRRV